MDFNQVLEELKKIRVPLLVACGVVFFVTLFINICSRPPAQPSVPQPPYRSEKKGGIHIIQDKLLTEDRKEGSTFQVAEKLFMRRQGRNAFLLRKKGYRLREEELMQDPGSNAAAHQNDSSNRLQNPDLHSDRDKQEAEMLFRKPKRTLPGKKQY